MFRHDFGPDAFAESFGSVLKRIRQRKGVRQLDLATEISVDHSLVSRWESGSLLPTAKNVDELRKVMKLADEDSAELDYAWRRDRSVVETDRHGQLVEDEQSDVVEACQISIECVRALRHAGQPRIAMRLSARDAHHTLDRLRSTNWSSLHQLALNGVAELLLEQCKAGLDFLPRSSVRDGGLASALKLQNFVVLTTKDEQAIAHHRIASEGVAYVGGDVGSASSISQALLDDPASVPNGWLPEVVRASAINAGKFEDRETLDKVELQLKSLFETELESITTGTRAFVLEGVARGMAPVNPERAIALVGEAWTNRADGSDAEATSNLRFVQLARTQAEVELRVRASSNLADTLSKVESAIVVSRREGYDRYIGQLESLATRLVD